MTCFRLPLSLDDAEAIVVACSGQADWRPLFLMGLGTVAVAGFLVIGLLLVARAIR
jgi:D-arabinose 1-dehydrogenase-like Zn-dependent alcohol dehydrogenase